MFAALALGACPVACGGSEEQSTSAPLNTKEGTTAAREAAPDQDRPGQSPSGSAKGSPLAGFEDFAASLEGDVGVTMGPVGSEPPATAGELTTGSAWSTIKVPIAIRVIQDEGGPDGLSTEQNSQLEAALTASDNEAAEALFMGLSRAHGGITGAAQAVTGVLRDAGDSETVVSTQGRDGFSPYGQTEWSLQAQHQFMASLAGGCLIDAATQRYVLDLMGMVTSDLWGLGSAGVSAKWKGGWGPGVDGRYLVRQMGVLDLGGEPVVVTLAARPTAGDFESGQAIATELARWLARRPAPLDLTDSC